MFLLISTMGICNLLISKIYGHVNIYSALFLKVWFSSLFLPFNFCFAFPLLYHVLFPLHSYDGLQWTHDGKAAQHMVLILKHVIVQIKNSSRGKGRAWWAKPLCQHMSGGAMGSMPLYSHIKPYFIPRKKYISTYPEGKMLKWWESQSSWGMLILIKVRPGIFFKQQEVDLFSFILSLSLSLSFSLSQTHILSHSFLLYPSSFPPIKA